MEIIGRLTTDAKRKTVSNDREVVSFSIAVNDSYKPKDGEMKKALKGRGLRTEEKFFSQFQPHGKGF